MSPTPFVEIDGGNEIENILQTLIGSAVVALVGVSWVTPNLFINYLRIPVLALVIPILTFVIGHDLGVEGLVSRLGGTTLDQVLIEKNNAKILGYQPVWNFMAIISPLLLVALCTFLSKLKLNSKGEE